MGETLSRPVTDKYSQYFENPRFRVGASGMQGWRAEMEDAHTTVLSMGPEEPDCAFYGVYDGHCGRNIARYCGANLHKRVARSPHFAKGQYDKALDEGFLGTDADILDSELKGDGSGCTAVACLVTGAGQIVCGNAGDSRCVLSRGGEVFPLSYDHKPTNTGEMKRIQKAGGFVAAGRINGNLALSRAIGDFDFKQNAAVPAEDQIVSAQPQVISTQLQRDDEFIVLACDGIWDCMSNQEVVDYIHEELKHTDDLAAICEKTFDRCLAQTAPGVGCDNMTMMIVQFKDEFKQQLGLLPAPS